MALRARSHDTTLYWADDYVIWDQECLLPHWTAIGSNALIFGSERDQISGPERCTGYKGLSTA